MAHISASDRRPQLITAAIAVMTRDGVPAASTRAIAAELGIGQAMVHYVFGTKDELYRAVIEELTAEVAEQVRGGELSTQASFRAAVLAFASDLWRSVVEQPATHQLLTELVVLGLRSHSLRPAITDYQRELDDAYADLFARAAAGTSMQPLRPISDVARLFAAGIDGLIVQRLARQDDVADQRSLADLVEATVASAEGRLTPPIA
jgi:AcrR family transcriptional regulator